MGEKIIALAWSMKAREAALEARRAAHRATGSAMEKDTAPNHLAAADAHEKAASIYTRIGDPVEASHHSEMAATHRKVAERKPWPGRFDQNRGDDYAVAASRILQLAVSPAAQAATHGNGADGGSGIANETGDSDSPAQLNDAFQKAKKGATAKINHAGTATYLHGGPVGVSVMTHAANGAVLHHGFIDQNSDGQKVTASPNGAPLAVLGSVHDAITHVKENGQKLSPGEYKKMGTKPTVTGGDTALS